MKKNVFNTVIITLLLVFVFAGCVEPQYYRQNQHHSQQYDQRHHRTPPPGKHF